MLKYEEKCMAKWLVVLKWVRKRLHLFNQALGNVHKLCQRRGLGKVKVLRDTPIFKKEVQRVTREERGYAKWALWCDIIYESSPRGMQLKQGWLRQTHFTMCKNNQDLFSEFLFMYTHWGSIFWNPNCCIWIIYMQ